MRESIVAAQHYPFPLRNKAYADQAVMKMTSEVDNNTIPFLGFVLINIPMEKFGIGKVTNRDIS